MILGAAPALEIADHEPVVNGLRPHCVEAAHAVQVEAWDDVNRELVAFLQEE